MISMKPGIGCIGVGCGCLILNEKNEVLLVKRSKTCKTDRGCGPGLAEAWSSARPSNRLLSGR